MSTKYRDFDSVPTDKLKERLRELSNAIGKGPLIRENEFTMRIPAEHDRDADLVLISAARRLSQLEEEIQRLKTEIS